MKVYLDNNFFTNYESCSDELYKRKIKDAFVSRKLSFYSSYELLDEVMGIAKAGINKQLIGRLNLILEILSGRIFNTYGNIIKGELGLAYQNIYASSRSVRKKLSEICNGLVPQKEIDILLNEDIRQKNEHFEYYKKQQQIFRKKQDKKENISFDNFKQKDGLRYSLTKLIEDILKGQNISGFDSKAKNIYKDIKRYKYFNTYLDIIAALNYKYYRCNHEVKRSDFFDALHLVYLTDLDVFFTNDKKLGWLCDIIFEGKKKVIHFDAIRQYL